MTVPGFHRGAPLSFTACARPLYALEVIPPAAQLVHPAAGAGETCPIPPQRQADSLLVVAATTTHHAMRQCSIDTL